MHPQGWGKLNVHIAQLWAHVRLCARRKWVISAILTVVRLLPVFPQLQTCRCTALTDAMCHERTSGTLPNRSKTRSYGVRGHLAFWGEGVRLHGGRMRVKELAGKTAFVTGAASGIG